MTVDSILFETIAMTVREEFGKLFVFQGGEGDSSYTATFEFVDVTGTETAKHSAHGGVIGVTFVFDAHVDYVDGFVHQVLVDACSEMVNVDYASWKLKYLFVLGEQK